MANTSLSKHNVGQVYCSIASEAVKLQIHRWEDHALESQDRSRMQQRDKGGFKVYEASGRRALEGTWEILWIREERKVRSPTLSSSNGTPKQDVVRFELRTESRQQTEHLGMS